MSGKIVTTIDASGGLPTSSLLRNALLATGPAAAEEQSGAVRKVLVDRSGRPLSIDDHVWTEDITVIAMQVGGASDD